MWQDTVKDYIVEEDVTSVSDKSEDDKFSSQ